MYIGCVIVSYVQTFMYICKYGRTITAGTSLGTIQLALGTLELVLGTLELALGIL